MGTDGNAPVRAGSIRRSFGYAAPAWRVFEAMTTELDNWWCHRSQPESAYTFEGGLGGRLLETVDAQVTVLAVASVFDPPSAIRIEGHLLLPKSVRSVVTFEVGGGSGAGLVLEHEWEGDTPVRPSALRHSWGELLGGSFREYVDAGWSEAGRSWRAKYPMWAAVD